MPSRNSIKIDVADSFYHVYNRGVNKQKIFNDERDYAVFLSLFKRHLGLEPEKDQSGREYPNYSEDIELLSFCLMPNHFHLLFYQHKERAMTDLMRSVCTAYTMYFNKRYGRIGHLFQGRFKASLIQRDSYLLHISRYIHLNSKDYNEWPYSSLSYYLNRAHAEWIHPERILALFEGDDYGRFLTDHKSFKRSLEEINQELADI